MENNKVLEETLEWIAKYINLMGQAGLNDINKFSITDNPAYNIVFESKAGDGRDYHYYDYNFAVSSILDQKLLVQTKAVEKENGNDYDHITKIAITYFLEDGAYRLVKYINGWNHQTLIDFKNKDFENSTFHQMDNEDDYIETLSLTDSYKGLFRDYQLKDIYGITNNEIKRLIQANEYNQRLINEVLHSLTEEQINVLKKTLKVDGLKK